MPRIELERLEEIDDTAQGSTETFDRIAFAQRALQLVRPHGTTVAICEGARRINVQAGRQWGGAEGERWAILSVPENASRRAITNAVLELGLAVDRLGEPDRLGNRARPWALDVLMSGGA